MTAAASKFAAIALDAAGIAWCVSQVLESLAAVSLALGV